MKKILFAYAFTLLFIMTSCNNNKQKTNFNEAESFAYVVGKLDKPNQMSHKDSLKMIVNKYFKYNKIVFQKGSTIEDIDAIFKLFTDDFIYVHPKYGGTYSREVLYNGYKRNQANGGYDGSVTDIRIDNMIIGLNAVVIEKRFIHGSEIKDPEMTLFEFQKGKISKIFEYW